MTDSTPPIADSLASEQRPFSEQRQFSEQRPFDVVIFGATGFVGKLISRYMADHATNQESVRWAVAGRSSEKLAKLVESLPTPKPAILIADSTDADSLRQLCLQTKVVLSTVGPYALYGSLLVQTCAETGTDYCDLTAEVQWIRRMIDRHSATAAETGARIIHACGFDSIPSDLGAYFLQQQARDRHNAPCQQIKYRFRSGSGGFSGGTLLSGITLLKETVENAELRSQIADPYYLCPADTAKVPQSPPLIEVQEDEAFGEWVTPFMMAPANVLVVMRSQALLGDLYGSDFQYDEGILTAEGTAGAITAQLANLFLRGTGLALALPPSRWLLQKTVIPAPGDGPSPESIENGFYDIRFWGKTEKGDVLRAKVTGDRDPGYGSTAKILAQAGLCLAFDCPKSELAGGFWTPASALGQKAISRLINYAGLTFECLDSER